MNTGGPIAAIRSWYRDGQFRRLVKNAGILLCGNITTNVLELFSLALTARALGPEGFGTLVLIQTYVRVVDALINFQSWQAVTKYGADALEGKRYTDFRCLIKFGTLIDGCSAALGALLSALGAFFAGRLLGWPAETVEPAMLFSIVILFNLVGTPTAVLRLFDRFKLLAGVRAGASGIKLILLTALFFNKAGLGAFLWAWMGAQILEYLLVFAAGHFELRRRVQGVGGGGTLRGITRRFPGLPRFVLVTNISSSIRLAASEADVLLVGALIGTRGTGLYKIARQFAMIPARLADPLQQAIYPEMARLWARGDVQRFTAHIRRMGILAGVSGILILLLFALGGKWILLLIVGKDYVPAWGLLLLYMSGIVIFMFGVAFRPALLSMEHPDRILAVYSGATLIHAGALIFLVNTAGTMGAAAAQVLFHLTWFTAMAFSIRGFLGAPSQARPPEKGAAYGSD